jgi:hypothetical protein
MRKVAFMRNRTPAERVVIVSGETAPGSEKVRVPAAARSLLGFRPWARSDRFPENGRIDARGDRLHFELRILENGEYRLARPDRKSWVHSPLLGGRVRVTRRPAHQSGWLYELERESG